MHNEIRCFGLAPPKPCMRNCLALPRVSIHASLLPTHQYGEQLSLLAEGSLTSSESGNERLRQEAENSRAEIWRKIQTAKLNNSQKQVNFFVGSGSAVPAVHVPT